MKRAILVFFLLSISSLTSRADSFWIETPATGQIGKQQPVSIFFGSHSKDLREAVTAEFVEVKDFTAWVISPTGKKIDLVCHPNTNRYESVFTPTENGVYVILVEEKLRSVQDLRETKTKIGIAKQNYYARAAVQVGQATTVSPLAYTDLNVVKEAEGQSGMNVTLKILYHGKPVPNAKMTMRTVHEDELTWQSDAEGKVYVKGQKPGFYTFLVTLRFEQPGTFKGVPFAVIREKSTLALALAE